MKISNDNKLVSSYKEKLQKICKYKITEAYISNTGYLCISSKNGIYWTSNLNIILNCPRYIIALISGNDINKITLALNLI
jgi:hypothetical protein